MENLTASETAHAQEFHRVLVLRRREVEQRIKVSQAEQDSITQAIKGMEALYPHLKERYSSPTSGADLRGQAAALEVLRAANEDWLTIREIVTEMNMQGWIEPNTKDPEAAVRAALRRSSDKAHPGLEKRGAGRNVQFRLVKPSAPALTGALNLSSNDGGAT